jgi:hypothetical protein
MPIRPEIISDDEMRRLFRLAEALALSKVYKDVTSAEQGFAKLIVGYELGLNVSQSMSIHFVEGQVTVPYPLLGLFVKAHGFSFKYVTLTDEAVAIEFFDPAGESVGLSTFTQDDALAAGITKKGQGGSVTTPSGKASNYAKYPRNMLIARAMSNGVRWFVQEATGGLPVYVEGEVVEEVSELTAGEGDGTIQGIELGPKVDAIIERAGVLGHAGLSNRAAIEVALGRRAPAVVTEWVGRAKAELDAFEARRISAEPADAEVVDEKAPESVSPPPSAVETVGVGVDVEVLRKRLSGLYDARAAVESGSDEEAQMLDDEIASVEGELRAAGGDVPGQEAMDL